ncbi:MAG: VCBS repeat-containing protein, partial [Muribaculaceae bacterium]|nr:VCBS repeat-containing protein [Muribaculaceae bacterium]
MRKVKLFLLFALAAMYAGASTFSVVPYYSYPELWADVNGDGVMEVLVSKNFTAADSSSIPQEVFTYTNNGSKCFAMTYEDAEKQSLIQYIRHELAVDNNLISRDGNYYVKLSYIFFGEDPEEMYGEKWKQELASQFKIETIIDINGAKYALVTPENMNILYGGTSGTSDLYFVFIDGKLCVDVTSRYRSLPEMVYFGYYFCNVSGDIVATVRESVQKRDSYNYPEWWEKLSIYTTDTDNDGIPEVFVSDNSANKMELMKLSGNKFVPVAEYPAAQYFYMYDIKLPLLPTDINIDGRTDYYYYGQDGMRYILMQLADNTFNLTPMSITTDEELIGKQEIGVKSNYGNKFIKPTINMTGFSGGDYVPTKFADNISISVDVNLDGYPDLIDTENGSAYLSLGDGRTYYPANFGGKMEVVDLNGDGISDFVVFDSESGQVFTRMSSTEGYVEKNLLKNSGLSKMYVCDFNGDNNADILLSIDYLGTYSYLIF